MKKDIQRYLESIDLTQKAFIDRVEYAMSRMEALTQKPRGDFG